MEPRAKNDVVSRLETLQCQVRGLTVMVESEHDPADVLAFIAAIRAALDGVGSVILMEQVEAALECAPGRNTLTSAEIAERTERIKKALACFVS